MFTVHKYQLPTSGFVVLDLPGRSKTLCVKVQYGVPVLYVLKDMRAFDFRRVHIQAVLTGESVPRLPCKHVGTAMLHDGTFVVHYFSEENV